MLVKADDIYIRIGDFAQIKITMRDHYDLYGELTNETKAFIPSNEKVPHLVNDYLSKSEDIYNFYNRYPSLENFSVQWEEKSNHKIDRKTLVEVLNDQNQSLTLSPLTRYNINSFLEEDTFQLQPDINCACLQVLCILCIRLFLQSNW